ncbi:MAG TPA: hypothetical protein VF707_19085 [Ardenticatenaceae bacterium]|jgi:HAMP domain-containing protein
MTDFVDINLLPRPVRPRTIQVDTRWRLPMIVGLGLMTIALLLLMAAFLQKIRNDRLLVRQEDELQDLGTPVAAYAITQAEVEALQEQLSTLARQVDQLEGDAERVERENPSLAPFLRALTGTLLPRMTITGIVEDADGHFIVQGQAGASALVTDYVNALNEHPDIGAVTPRSVEQLGGDAPPGAVRWTLEVER